MIQQTIRRRLCVTLGRSPSIWLWLLWAAGALLGSPAQGSEIGGQDGSLILATGVELEGLDESFGGEFLGLLSDGNSSDIGGDGTVDDQISGLRYRDRESSLLAVAELRGYTSSRSSLNGLIDLEAKVGEKRRSLTAETTASGREGSWSKLSVRNLLMVDEEQDGATSLQDLLYLRLKQSLGQSDWQLAFRGTLDFSRAEGSEGDADSVLTDWYDYLDYEKAGLRIEVSRWGLSNSALAVKGARKWSHGASLGDYTEVGLSAEQGWFRESGMLNLDAEVERRSYKEEGGTLPSFYEASFSGYWFGQVNPRGWQAKLLISGTDYDEPDTTSSLDGFSVFNDDVIEVEAELMWRTYLVGGLLADRRGALFGEVELGIGPAAKLRRYNHATGDGQGAGGRLEAAVRGELAGDRWWLEAGCELGRYDYRASGDSTQLAFEDLTLSLAQSDYTYLELSLICGGRLPYALEWEGYGSIDQEWHSAADDNARLISFSLALRRRFDLLGR